MAKEATGRALSPVRRARGEHEDALFGQVDKSIQTLTVNVIVRMMQREGIAKVESDEQGKVHWSAFDAIDDEDEDEDEE